MWISVLGFILPFLIVLALEIVTRFSWAYKWQERKIEGISFSFFQTTLRVVFPTLLGILCFLFIGNPFLAVSSAVSSWLIIVVLYTDIISMKIPREACWVVFFINVGMLLFNYSIVLFASAIVSFVLVAFVLIVTAIISKGGLGSGDLRLMLALSLLGGWFGYTFIMFGLIIGSVMQIPVRLVLKKQKPSKKTFPFAPSLIAGFLLSLIFIGNINAPYNEWSGILV